MILKMTVHSDWTLVTSNTTVDSADRKEVPQTLCRPPRKGETELTQFHMDLAASIQVVTEEIVLKLAKSLRDETGVENLCLAGGVALNCVANGKLLQEKVFNDIWIQPASGDAGSALGAALVGWHQHQGHERVVNTNDSMKGTYLGPEFTNDDIIKYLEKINAPFQSHSDPELFERLAEELEKGRVIGWFNGPMEFGPRALGGRSIIGDPRNQKMQSDELEDQIQREFSSLCTFSLGRRCQ